jgi:glycosyltransferase involved in cell wall biosynthesis
MDKITVSVIIPIRNEEQYISACLKSLLYQTYPNKNYEILVIDGLSSDRSKDIVHEFQRTHPSVICLDNAAAIVPAAMNIGIRHARGDIIIRADGHNSYPRDYIQNCLNVLEETGADNVGGPWLTVPADDSFSARLVAAVLTNPFGVGDSQFRIGTKEGFVETVPFGAFRSELFDRIGMYNEKLVRNQDNDLNARIRQAGGKIYQTPALTTEYHPVAGFGKLLRQTLKTSQWHVFSMRQTFGSMGARHLAPALFVFLLATLLGLSWTSVLARYALVLLLISYLLTGLYFVISRGQDRGFVIRCTLLPACAAFHVAYGIGTFAGLRYLVGSAPPSAPIRAGQAVRQRQQLP